MQIKFDHLIILDGCYYPIIPRIALFCDFFKYWDCTLYGREGLLLPHPKFCSALFSPTALERIFLLLFSFAPIHACCTREIRNAADTRNQATSHYCGVSETETEIAHDRDGTSTIHRRLYRVPAYIPDRI